MTNEAMRLDKWLWFARFRRSRALAAELCLAGRVRVNRQVVSKPAVLVRVGDVVTLPAGPAIKVVQILRLPERRGPPAEAVQLYCDVPVIEPEGPR